jgi:hypothetical protein
MMESGDRGRVAIDTVILIVPPELENKETMLFFYRQMQMLSAPLGDTLESPCEPVSRCLTLHHPSVIYSLTPVVSETKKIKASRVRRVPFVALATRPGESDEPGLVRVQRQSKLPKALR